MLAAYGLVLAVALLTLKASGALAVAVSIASGSRSSGCRSRTQAGEELATMTRDPHPKAPGTGAGITEAMIRNLVHAFYARVRCDPVLGPIFNTRVEDWPAHLEKLCAFWSSVMLMTGRYKGTPMRAHAELPAIAPAHFQRWLALFQGTVRETCPDAAASLFADRSERIAQSLRLGIALNRGEVPAQLPPGVRGVVA
jgi:hemoglobin